MSGDQQATTKWMIRVDGSDLTSVEAGQTVEIGRKPLRPLSDDGTTRVEILDDTRSMSKRHAEFSVKSDGNAILRDMNSTNGTYLVRPGNDLVRLPSGSDFALTDDTVRLAARHADTARVPREGVDRLAAGGVADERGGFVACEDFKGEGLQSIARQKRRILSERLVVGGLAAAQVVVVHAGQVVVNQRVGVNHLDRAGKGQRRLRFAAAEGVECKHQHGAHALAARLQAVAHGLDQLSLAAVERRQITLQRVFDQCRIMVIHGVPPW